MPGQTVVAKRSKESGAEGAAEGLIAGSTKLSKTAESKLPKLYTPEIYDSKGKLTERQRALMVGQLDQTVKEIFRHNPGLKQGYDQLKPHVVIAAAPEDVLAFLKAKMAIAGRPAKNPQFVRPIAVRHPGKRPMEEGAQAFVLPVVTVQHRAELLAFVTHQFHHLRQTQQGLNLTTSEGEFDACYQTLKDLQSVFADWQQTQKGDEKQTLLRALDDQMVLELQKFQNGLNNLIVRHNGIQGALARGLIKDDAARQRAERTVSKDAETIRSGQRRFHEVNNFYKSNSPYFQLRNST